MEILIIIIVGGFIGWLASLIAGTASQQGLILNIVVGVIGSLLGKYIFADLLNIGSAWMAGTFSIAGIFWGVVGAVILITILRLLNIY